MRNRILACVIVLLLSSTTALASIARVQAASDTGRSATTCVLDASSATAWASSGSAHLIYVEVATYTGGARTLTISDNKSDTYTALFNDAANCQADGDECNAWYLQNAPSGITAITITGTSMSSSASFCSAAEYSGVALSSALDTQATIKLATSPWTSNSITPAAGLNEVLIGFAANSQTQTDTVTGSWAKAAAVEGFSEFLILGEQIVASTSGSYTFTGTASTGSTGMTLFAFKAAAAGAEGTEIIGPTELTGPTILQ